MVNFGLVCYQDGLNYSTIRKIALESERLGFDSLWVHDHLACHNTYFPMTPILEAWTLLSALSVETSKIKLGSLVLCNSYRNPALLAKMVATLDVISNGRFELGIGAGWQKIEQVSYGFSFPKGSTRLAKLDESLKIMKKMWTEKKTTFEGEYFSVKDAVCEPKPVQKPYPPIWIGGSGTQMLKLVATHSAGCNFCGLPIERYKERLDVLKEHCDALGTNFDKINKSLFIGLVIGSYKKQVVKQLLSEIWDREEFSRAFFHPKRALKVVSNRMNAAHSAIIAGSPDDCIEKIQQYVDLGVNYFMFKFPFIKNFALEIFAEKVMSKFK